MFFTNHYAGSPVCAPSRATLMTGQHTGHTRIRGNNWLPEIGTVPLDLERPILPEVIKDGTNYTTAISGRWHLGGIYSDQQPYQRGFDYHFGKLSALYPDGVYAHAGVYNGGLYDEAGKHIPEAEYIAKGIEPMFLNGSLYDLTPHDLAADTINQDRMVTEKAVEYIGAEREQPYFLFVAYSLPHSPMTYHPDFPVPDTLPAPERAFVSMMMALDAYVGRIVAAVEASGQAENTLIMFASDNGAHNEMGHKYDYFDSSGPYREYKRSFLDGGVRSPFIARWDGTIPAGSTSDHLSAFYDVMPTLCELTGARCPEAMDGVSFAPTLTGRGQQAEHDYLYWEFNENLYFKKTEFKQAVRKGKWKGIYYVDPDRFELYDLSQDTGERTDVSVGHPEVVAELRQIMATAHEPSELFPLLPSERGISQ